MANNRFMCTARKHNRCFLDPQKEAAMSTSRISRLLMLTISIVLFAALLIGCGGTTPSVATPTPPPTAAPACLTVNTPSFTKLSDGKYVLNVDVVNCGSDESWNGQVPIPA